jgi:hypothetical protein
VNPLIAANTIYCNSFYPSYISLPLENYTLGIENHKPIDEVTVYPNPTSSDLFFATNSYDTFEVTIYSLNGNKVTSFVMNQSFHFNAKEFNDGFYIAEIKNKMNGFIISKSFELIASK